MHRMAQISTATLACLAVALTSGCATDVTRGRIESSIGPTFARLYARQTQLLGQPTVTVAGIQARSTCDRGGPKVADRGPGADWICMITFVDTAHVVQAGKFELQVRSNSCYTAAGPSKLIGPAVITNIRGEDVPNPVFEFDGCFDPRA